MQLIRVALDVPLSILFDYKVEHKNTVKIGQRVLVPFRRKEVVGIVMELVDASDVAAERIKDVVQILHDVPPLSDECLVLLRFCSEYYHHPLGQVVMSALPTRLRNVEPLRLKLEQSFRLTELGQSQAKDALLKRKVVQMRILLALRLRAQREAAMLALSPSARSNLKVLLETGWIETFEDETIATVHRLVNTHILTAEQNQAVEAVTQITDYRCFLLHGVTGSGKTEIYVHLMNHVLQRSQQVLLLVPEINLTPQLEQYFRSRFPDTELVSLHSGLDNGLRAQNWLRAQSGKARIILGTRLAVFTPLPQLGLILVDEEHDSSFKQQDGLHYSARDIAIFRANQRRVPIVLGSATPSLETYFNAQSGRYQMLKLTQRAVQQAQLPQVRCININNTPLQEGLSPVLLSALGECLLRGEQSLVFINRRGYSPVLMCAACGWLSGCPNCVGKLVLHLNDKRLRCHHCGYQTRVPLACPSCGNLDLQPVGVGTQRVEAALKVYFPEARILRADRDSTRNKGTWNAMRQKIQDGTADILVGTQILAKGHDFPNLTLVGVLNPDGALYSADFRAPEKLYAQLVQVAGRAGRADKLGEVLVQTAFPDHPLFRALCSHDYDAWAKILLVERKMASFPPYVFQAMLRAEGRQPNEVFTFLNRARDAAKALAHEVEIYGVVPSSLPKLAQHTRAQLLMQATSRNTLQSFLRAWLPILAELASTKLRWSLDIDPLEF